MTTSRFIAQSAQSDLFGHPIAMPVRSNTVVDTAGRMALALLPFAALVTLFVGF